MARETPQDEAIKTVRPDFGPHGVVDGIGLELERRSFPAVTATRVAVAAADIMRDQFERARRRVAVALGVTVWSAAVGRWTVAVNRRD